MIECNCCTWAGSVADAVMCGDVGPLCPRCHETTAPVEIKAAAQFHILPVNDIYEHKDIGTDCWCRPTTEGNPGYPSIVIHNSADDREKFETGTRKPS